MQAHKTWVVPCILGWSDVTSSLEGVILRQLPASEEGGTWEKGRSILQCLGTSFAYYSQDPGWVDCKDMLINYLPWSGLSWLPMLGKLLGSRCPDTWVCSHRTPWNFNLHRVKYHGTREHGFLTETDNIATLVHQQNWPWMEHQFFSVHFYISDFDTQQITAISFVGRKIYLDNLLNF